jgi:hypothetical protein
MGKKKRNQGRAWWLMPIIIAIWEATVTALAKSLGDLILTSHLSSLYAAKHKWKDCSAGQPSIKQDPISKLINTHTQKGWQSGSCSTAPAY